MASYTLFCGDTPVCTVSHKTESYENLDSGTMYIKITII